MKQLLSFAAALALAFCASFAGASVNGGFSPAPSGAYGTAPAQNAGQSFSGRAIAVLDGDTIDVLLPDNSVERVRLAGIDAPEKDQSFGAEAKANLARKLRGQIVTVHFDERDKYGRAVGHVYFRGATPTSSRSPTDAPGFTANSLPSSPTKPSATWITPKPTRAAPASACGKAPITFRLGIGATAKADLSPATPNLGPGTPGPSYLLHSSHDSKESAARLTSAAGGRALLSQRSVL